MEEDSKLYLRRQAIVEHPYGTIKRQWGFDPVLSKKDKKRSSADIGIIFNANNLKRILSLRGKKGFQEVYGQLVPCFPTDPINTNFCPDPTPNLKKPILVRNWQ